MAVRDATYKHDGHADAPEGVPKLRRFQPIADWFTSVLEVSGRTDRIIPMEGMRGFAVLLVFLVHHHTLFGGYLPYHGLAYRMSEFGHAIGYSGVDLFFVLSGFLIYEHLMRKKPPYFKFIRRRVQRIYPTFFCVVCVYLLIGYAIPSLSKLPQSASKQVEFLFQNLLLLPGLLRTPALITVSWSLSYEFFFYLSLPLIIGLMGMRFWSRPWRIIFFICVFTVHCAAYRLDLLPHIRLNMFVAGILLYEVTTAGWFKEMLSVRGEIAVIVCYLLVLLALGLVEFSSGHIRVNAGFPNYDYVTWTAALAIALSVVALYSFEFDGVLKAVFSFTALRWLGNMSYSYYLIHSLVLNGVALAMEYLFPAHAMSALLFSLVLVGNLMLTLGGSVILFILVEKPFSLASARPLTAAPRRGGVVVRSEVS
jgi:exopolysaccharide production protein ExoZ